MVGKRLIQIGDVGIPLESYAIGGTALLGIRASGKTWTGKSIAEQLLEHRIPIIVFDPIGVWRHLKVPAKKNGKGYPIVVAGGKGADIPLSPSTATEIVRAAMRENIPLVIDLYDKSLSKADWRRIVQASFRTLLYENEGMRHIFLEEAAEYVPQTVRDGETYAEVEKLVRMGGNASLGITLINQRAQEVNKAVLDLCDECVRHGDAARAPGDRGDGGCTVERIPCSFCKGSGEVYDVQARKWEGGRKLSEARIAAGRSLREFATLLGLSPARMSDIEHGREGANYPRLHERLRDW